MKYQIIAHFKGLKGGLIRAVGAYSRGELIRLFEGGAIRGALNWSITVSSNVIRQ